MRNSECVIESATTDNNSSQKSTIEVNGFNIQDTVKNQTAAILLQLAKKKQMLQRHAVHEQYNFIIGQSDLKTVYLAIFFQFCYNIQCLHFLGI